MCDLSDLTVGNYKGFSWHASGEAALPTPGLGRSQCTAASGRSWNKGLRPPLPSPLLTMLSGTAAFLAYAPPFGGPLTDHRFSSGISAKTTFSKARSRGARRNFSPFWPSMPYTSTPPAPGPWGSVESQATGNGTIGSWMGRSHVCGGQVSMEPPAVLVFAQQLTVKWIPGRCIYVLWEI